MNKKVVVQRADLPISHKQLELIKQAQDKQLLARKRIREVVDGQKKRRTVEMYDLR